MQCTSRWVHHYQPIVASCCISSFRLVMRKKRGVVLEKKNAPPKGPIVSLSTKELPQLHI